MKLIYSKNKWQDICNDKDKAAKFFGGDKKLGLALLAVIQALDSAVFIHDIIVLPQYRFHKLYGDREGFFAIDIKGKKNPWRLILQPLDENEEPFVPCHIDQIAKSVKVVEITEVSKHYE